MFRKSIKDKLGLFLLIAVIIIKLFSLNESWVEKYYTYGLYPIISNALRFLLGWSAISIGDVLYTAAGLYLAVKFIVFFRLCMQQGFKKAVSWQRFWKWTKRTIAVYLLFNILWGLNYNRHGISHQLKLEVAHYSTADLQELLGVLQQRLCFYGDRVDNVERGRLQTNDVLFSEGIETFEQAQKIYPFLAYTYPSLKASLYSPLGHYFGFTGYYNPFTAEAQIKVSIPVFLKPFVLCHEIGHQLGYAKENEANFVSFLACRGAENVAFRYSVYFEMWLYTLRELSRSNPGQTILAMKTAHPQVQQDYLTFVAYLKSTDNKVEPYFSLFYDRYLKINNQPKGRATYNEVVAWMIAYMKKMGRQAI